MFKVEERVQQDKNRLLHLQALFAFFSNFNNKIILMLPSLHYTVIERFLRYVQIDTQSNPHSSSFPSTEKQKNLSKLLLQELKAMGIENAFMDEYGYVYASLPANTTKKVPAICFCSHVDTAPDCSGTHVKPILHKNYQGNPIILPDAPNEIISIEEYPYLKHHIGKDIITASGLTLLGADDKSGLAEIMDMLYQLTLFPQIKHGAVHVVFTPDEETGRGTEHIQLEALASAYCYTLDGGEARIYEEETFSADSFLITIQGISAHPGYAKGKMINAIKVAADIIHALPKNSWSPETTEGREGFVHPVHIEGNAETATIELIIRDFETIRLLDYENRLKQITQTVIQNSYPKAAVQFTVQSQYRNMNEIVQQHPLLKEYAKQAYTRAGLPFHVVPVRGGTDGSKLSFMGLPCPNLFTGMQAIHSRHEWIGVEDMKKAVEMLLHLVQIWEENS